MRTELHVGDRVDVLCTDYRGTVTDIAHGTAGGGENHYEVTPDDTAHLARDGKPYRWPAGWLRKLTTLELVAEAAV